MNLIYQQIELEDGLLQEAALDLIEKIHDELHSYKDNGPINIKLGHGSKRDLDAALKVLKKHKIILYYYGGNDYAEDYCEIVVIDRYKLELLSAELIWLARPEQEKGPDDNTAPYEDDLVYYDTRTGELLFNGVHKILKKRNKALFDALFTAAPGYADRKKLLTIARSGKYANEPAKLVVSEAFTNLRKVCGVRSHAIELSSSGGKLNAEIYPLSAQLPPRYISKLFTSENTD